MRELADRLLAGESLNSLCRDLNRRQVPPVAAQRWSMTAVRGILNSARIAGLRDYKGEVNPGPWAAIIDPDQHYRLRALLDANARAGHRALRRFFLTGQVRCGLCGARMTGHMVLDSKSGRRRAVYNCRRTNSGCGKISVMAEPVETLAAEALFEVVDSPEFARRLDQGESRPAHVRDELERLGRRLTELAETWAEGEITRTEWQAARAKLRERMAALHHEEGEAARDGVLDRWGELSLREAWPSLTVDQRRSIARAVIDWVVIAPVGKATPAGTVKRFDPRRVTIERKL